MISVNCEIFQQITSTSSIRATSLQTKSNSCVVFMYSLSMEVCHFLGMIVFAGFVMYSMYWLLYAFHLYMKVAHPDYSMLLDSWHRTKKFYYFEIGFFTLIGTLPYLILASLSEFQIVQFPPLFCALSAEGNFYGIVLPTIVINCTTLIILLLVLYHIHMVSRLTEVIVL